VQDSCSRAVAGDTVVNPLRGVQLARSARIRPRRKRGHPLTSCHSRAAIAPWAEWSGATAPQPHPGHNRCPAKRLERAPAAPAAAAPQASNL